MAEDTQQAIEAPVSETQDSATPTEEQKTAEPSKEVSENELPNEASERTRSSFERLTSELAEERRRREALENAFSTLKPKETVVEPEVQPIYDPDTGLLNEQALTTVQLRAIEAEKQAHQTQQELNKYLEERKKEAQEREDQEAFTAHPELDPKNTKAFNKDLRDVAASLMLQSMVHPEEFGGKQLSHKEAGDKAKELINKLSGNVREEATREAIEQLSPKEQAALEATGSQTVHTDATNLDDLKRRTRRGDESAIVERLRRVKTQ